MLDMVIQFAKELKGMQVGNRNMQIKISNLKRQLGEMHNTVQAWKAKHQKQHDIAEHLLQSLYTKGRFEQDGIPYAVWRYDYLKGTGFITEELTTSSFGKTIEYVVHPDED
jgi:hypothetical protein